MQFRRSSGVLLHVSSLPSYGGIGDLGPAAHEFVRFLAAARQHVWQVLPICPTGYGNSPYSGTSAFAGNPLLISLEYLSDWGWIDRGRLEGMAGRSGNVDFEAVKERKLPLLYEAADHFLDRATHHRGLAEQWRDFEEFCRTEAGWLGDYALYAVLRSELGTGAWTEWPDELKRREPQALARVAAGHSRPVMRAQALQFAFSRQWGGLRKAAAEHGIRILGDVAIFVNMDSSDVWVHPEIFELGEDLLPVRVAGVPPDYFSESGQRWGNPVFRWDVLARSGYDWWTERMARARALYDIVRLDHFRGFEAYWSIPADEMTAIHGEWRPGPGRGMFDALEARLGPLPLVAEDLGLITAEVDALRQGLKMPGMKVIQFGFGDPGAHVHLPHRFEAETVAYTGTHDNDTTQGWWDHATREERRAVEAYVGAVRNRPVWPLMRAMATSVAQMTVFPAQDVLELGSEARMNTPAVADGNWRWRTPEGCWTPKLAARLAEMAEVTDRDNDPLS